MPTRITGGSGALGRGCLRGPPAPPGAREPWGLPPPRRPPPPGGPPPPAPRPPSRSCRYRLRFDDRIVLPSPPHLVTRIPDAPFHLGDGGPVGGAGLGGHVFLHHQAAEVVGAEAERHLPHLEA